MLNFAQLSTGMFYFSDDENHLHQLGQFVQSMQNVKKMEIQPYHQSGKHKYDALGWKYQLEGVEMNSQEQLLRDKEILS